MEQEITWREFWAHVSAAFLLTVYSAATVLAANV